VAFVRKQLYGKVVFTGFLCQTALILAATHSEYNSCNLTCVT